MATIYSDIATGQNSALVKDRVDGQKVTGALRIARCRYTTTGSTTTADVLNLVKLPKGAVVLPALCRIDTEDCGTDVSVKIGDNDATADDDRYTTAISLATAGVVAFTGGVAGPNPHTLAQESWIQATVVNAGSISVTSDRDFTVLIAYILP